MYVSGGEAVEIDPDSFGWILFWGWFGAGFFLGPLREAEPRVRIIYTLVFLPHVVILTALSEFRAFYHRNTDLVWIVVGILVALFLMRF